MWRLTATLVIAGCLPALTPDPDNAIDARYRASVAVPPSTTVNEIYGWVGERTLAVPSRCRMLPTDSEAFAIRVQRCGGLAAWYVSVARLMLEQAGDSRFTTSIRIDGRARWIDLPGPCGS